jgi:hypothetical protein
MPFSEDEVAWQSSADGSLLMSSFCEYASGCVLLPGCTEVNACLALVPPIRCSHRPSMRIALQVVQRAEDLGHAVIDPLHVMSQVLDRRAIRLRLQDIASATEHLVQWSEVIEIASERALQEKSTLLQSTLQRCDALICKPCIACGIHQSHNMVLLWDPKRLPHVRNCIAELLLQLNPLAILRCCSDIG